MKLIICALIFGVLAKDALSYLTEQPSWLTSCYSPNADFSQCANNYLTDLFGQMVNGIQGLNVAKTDPYEIKEMKASQDTDAGKFDLTLANVVTTGFAKAICVRDDVDMINVNNGNATFYIPKLNVDGDFKLVGQLLGLDLDEDTSFSAVFEDVVYTLRVKFTLCNNEGYTFANMTAVNPEYQVNNVRISVNNAKNQDLEALLQSNSRAVFDTLQPILRPRIEEFSYEHMHGPFNYIPAKFFISNIPDSNLEC